mmetsp:Transcript_26105/g.64833  ORF Transcript_26105/g.64833 Transcript_26105/m.64833 type:complete len:629 (+) Transcript_26105:72-1958(+)
MDLSDIILWMSVLAPIPLCPFTKVEESFNTQAVHDLMTYGVKQLEEYDHRSFPGVVPRSFLGAIIVAVITKTVKVVVEVCGFVWFPSLPAKMGDLLLSRFVLALLGLAALRCVKGALQRRFGRSTGVCFNLMLSAQFHIPFYLSRFLPNTFGLILSSLAFACWITGQDDSTDVRSRQLSQGVLCLLTFAAVVFRSELILVAVAASLDLWLVSNRLNLMEILLSCLMSGLGGVALSIAVDSFFWFNTPFTMTAWDVLRAIPARRLGALLQKPLSWFGSSLTALDAADWGFVWPEGMVFFFNAVQDKSRLWGVASWHWYFTSAVPKSMGPLLIFLPMMCIFSPDRRRLTWECFGVWLAPVYALSKLGHKEVRFIFPSLLALTAFLAIGLSQFLERFSNGRPKARDGDEVKRGGLRLLFWILTLFVMGSTAILSNIRLIASIYNYPGGHALTTLNVMMQRKHNGASFIIGNETSVVEAIHPNVLGQAVSRWANVSNWIRYSLIPLQIDLTNETSSNPAVPHSRQQFVPGSAVGFCRLHIDASAAQNGVSRFLHPSREVCEVSKEEDSGKVARNHFTFLLTSRRYIPGFRPLYSSVAFDRFTRSNVHISMWLRRAIYLHAALPVHPVLVAAD